MKRHAKFAGSFYPESPEEICEEVKRCFAEVAATGKSLNGNIRALLVPHAGYIYSGVTAAAGYLHLKATSFKRVLALGPTHRVAFRGVAAGNYNIWQNPLSQIVVSDAGELVSGCDEIGYLNEAHEYEHSLEVQLPFIQTVLPDAEWLPLVCGTIDKPDQVASAIDRYLKHDDLLLISTDLSHFLEYETACSTDKKTIDAILSGSINITGEMACGKEGVRVAQIIAQKNNWKPVLLDYRNSGDTAGDKSRVVGYTSIAFVEGKNV